MRGQKNKQYNKSGQRIFLVLKPPQEIRDIARDIRREMKPFEYKFGFVNLEELHLTIKFLGDNVSEKSLEVIEQELQELFSHYSAFKLKVTGLQFGFERQAKPRILFLTVEENKVLGEIKTKVNENLRDLKLYDIIRRKDRKIFTSHITVARINRDISKSFIRDVDEIVSPIKVPPVEFEVRDAYLIKSELTRKGARYQTIAQYPLRAS